MIKILFLLMPLLCLLGCETNSPFNTPEYEHVKAFNRMITPFVEEMRQTEALYPTIVSGQLMDRVNTVALHFRSEQSLSLEECRELYMRFMQKLLDQINNNEEIRPYLATYPFTENDLECDISFMNFKTYEHFQPPSIAHVFNIKQKICYSIDTSATDNNPLKVIHRETYSEAMKIVNGE